jgi:hypothetical protein
MRSEEEIRLKLADRVKWLDKWELSGGPEVGIEVGWEQALEWVLEEPGD